MNCCITLKRWIRLHSTCQPSFFATIGCTDGNDTYTKLLIHSNSSDGGTEFIDSSASGHTINQLGDAHHETDSAKLIFDSLERVLCWRPSSGAGHFLTLVAL